MKIDAHIHYMPPELAARLAHYARTEPYWGLLLGAGSVQGWASPEQMLADMDAAGIDRVVIQGAYPQRHETAIAQNNEVLALINRWPERVMAFAAIQPKAGQAALAELNRCLDGGMCGVGELNPYAQGYTIADADFLRLVDACAEANIPLNLHVSEEVGRHYPGKSTAPLRHYYWLAERTPGLKLILAHWGGGLIFYELMPAVRRTLANVWYDTAASPLLYPTAKIFPVALTCLDYRKILYGSDYPLRIVPRQQAGPDFRPFLAQIEGLGLPPEQYAAVMGGNAARLLGLVEAEETGESSALPAATSPPLRPLRIEGHLPVALVAQQWPETQAIFARYGLPWQDAPVPHWEPISQAAAARGLDAAGQQRLLDELNGVVG